jgi:hypothetical protein
MAGGGPVSGAAREHQARVGWFHELGIGLDAAVLAALNRLRAGDTSGAETKFTPLVLQPGGTLRQLSAPFSR